MEAAASLMAAPHALLRSVFFLFFSFFFKFQKFFDEIEKGKKRTSIDVPGRRRSSVDDSRLPPGFIILCSSSSPHSVFSKKKLFLYLRNRIPRMFYLLDRWKKPKKKKAKNRNDTPPRNLSLFSQTPEGSDLHKNGLTLKFSQKSLI